MRSLLSKITALAVAVFMMLGFLAVPAASAQEYPPSAPPPVNCANLAAPTIEIVGTSIVVTFPNGTLTCVIRVVIEVNPVLYDGPPPISGTLTLPVPAIDGDVHTASVTSFYATGDPAKSSSVAIPAAVLAAARAAAPAAVPAAVPATQQVAVPVAVAEDLAFTGSDVNVPLTVGAALVGAGGLVLLAARKRETNS